MAEHFSAPSVGLDLDAVSTTQEFQLGTIVQGTDQSGSYSAEYMYIKADAAISQYDAVHIDIDLEATPLTTTISGVKPCAVGVAQVAFADEEYGWVVISGHGIIGCISGGSAAANVRIYTTATAGLVDDVATDVIVGLVLTEAEGATTAAQATFHATTRMATNAETIEG